MRKRSTSSIATIRDVARESSVSIATVSHVINNGPPIVRPQTRERVLAAIEKLNYHPNAMARGLMRQRMNTIGVLPARYATPSVFANPYAAGIMQGVLEAAAALKYDVLLYTEPWADLKTSGLTYRDRRADGILSVSPDPEFDMVSGLVSLGLSVVAVSSDCLNIGVPSVDVDNKLGARLAADHLVHLGHRRIAMVTGDLNQISAVQRRDAFVEALNGHGIAVPVEYVRTASYEGAGGYEAFMTLMRLSDRPTAIFASNDTLAGRMYDAAKDAGINVPAHVSIVGFDDFPMFHYLTPALTTVNQPLAAIGDRATRILIEQICTGHVEIMDHLVAPTLVVREFYGFALRR